jgi:hypothetical protein
METVGHAPELGKPINTNTKWIKSERVYIAEDPPMVASRVEIGTPRGYLNPYLDTIVL